MDQKVVPLLPVYTGRTAMGAQNVRWQELTYRWANVKYLKGAKLLDTGETWLEHEIAVTLHYTAVITPRCRLKWNDRVYEILSVNGTRREGTLYIKARLIDDGADSAEVTATE